MVISELISISWNGNAYACCVGCKQGANDRMNVSLRVDERDGIEAVVWDRDLDVLLGHDLSSALPLFAAVLAIHQARKAAP